MGRFQRILRVLLHLQSGPRFNAIQLSTAFKVSCRTVYRDMAFLRDAGIPIIFDDANDSYRLVTDHLPALPKVLNLENLEMLLVAAKASPAYCVPAMAVKIDAAISDILNPLPSEVRDRVSALMNGFAATFQISHMPDPDEAIWTTMLKAIESHLKVNVRMRESGNTHRKKIAPYQIMASDAGWCVVGRTSLDKESRAFPLNDILAAELTEEIYTAPRGCRRIDPTKLAKSA